MAEPVALGDDAAVAAPPHRLGAHHGGGGFGGVVAKFGERVGELLAEGMVGVVVEAAVAPVSVDLEGDGARDVAATGEALASGVADAEFGEALGEGIVVKPGVLLRPG